LVFDFYSDDEEVLTLADDTKVTLAFLNPVLLAIKYKSFSCLKYLVSQYQFRQSMKQLDIVVRQDQYGGEYPFKNLVVPILAKIKDVEALSFLTRQDGFYITSQDFNSFISMTLAEKWLAGTKTFLQSPAAQFVFQTLTFDEKKLLIERIVKYISDIEDAKVKKSFITGIIDEVFTKKPYNKHLVLNLIEGSLKSAQDLPKLARECLKSLTSEDLMQLAIYDSQTMADYERKFTDA
jgi:hypothetical protein